MHLTYPSNISATCCQHVADIRNSVYLWNSTENVNLNRIWAFCSYFQRKRRSCNLLDSCVEDACNSFQACFSWGWDMHCSKKCTLLGVNVTIRRIIWKFTHLWQFVCVWFSQLQQHIETFRVYTTLTMNRTTEVIPPSGKSDGDLDIAECIFHH